MSTSASNDDHLRYSALDGWRGISISMVLACHLLPLGPKYMQLNAAAGALGMALFFTLSGFLITSCLIHNPSIYRFLVHRFARIAPLAWVALLLAMTFTVAPPSSYPANFLFFANIPPIQLTPIASHYWSLCVEVQFYLGIALVVRLFGIRGLYLAPLLAVLVTAHRIDYGALTDIVTWRRVDEIIAGCLLAMTKEGMFGKNPGRLLSKVNPFLLFVLLGVCSHPNAGFMNYIRPYVAALLVGQTLFSEQRSALMPLLESRALNYLATISFSLYVIHHILMYSWLGTGEAKEIIYLKRPVLFASVFILAHISTFYFEKRFLEIGRRLSSRPAARST